MEIMINHNGTDKYHDESKNGKSSNNQTVHGNNDDDSDNDITIL